MIKTNDPAVETVRLPKEMMFSGYVSRSTKVTEIITLASLKNITNKSPAFCGSTYLSDGPAGSAWYTVLYIPHRFGIDGDNALYGRLILWPMTMAVSNEYHYQKINNTWYGPYSK